MDEPGVHGNPKLGTDVAAGTCWALTQTAQEAPAQDLLANTRQHKLAKLNAVLLSQMMCDMSNKVHRQTTSG